MTEQKDRELVRSALALQEAVSRSTSMSVDGLAEHLWHEGLHRGEFFPTPPEVADLLRESPQYAMTAVIEHLAVNDWRVNALLAGVTPGALTVSQWRIGSLRHAWPLTSHEHEAWQIRESAKGGNYCAACGESVEGEVG